MAIISPLPYSFTNGTTADANQMMANLNQIVSNVNNYAAQLSLTPQLSLENIFTQPQQMSDPTKPAHAVTLGYATSNIGFLGSANTWTKNNIFTGGIDNTVIGATTPAAGYFTLFKGQGFKATGLPSFSGTGVGLEGSSDGTISYLNSYDRTNGVYKELQINASIVRLNNGSSGDVQVPNGLNNTPIGQTTPAAGKFTSLTTSSSNPFIDILNSGTGSQAWQITATTGAFIVYNNTNATTPLSVLNNGNFQVGSGSDSGDKFQVFGNQYIKNVGANAVLAIESTIANDSGISIKDPNHQYKLGVNIGGYGAGVFNIYDIANTASRLAVLPNGNTQVGSGADTGDKLQVFGTGNFTSYVIAQGSQASFSVKRPSAADGAGAGPLFQLTETTNNNALLMQMNGSYGLSFFSSAAGAAWAEKMRLTQAGRLLIGTTTDNGADVLQVNGSVSASGNVTLPSLNGGQLAGLRNKLINGNFDIWQRGTSFTANGYTADRWLLTLGSGAAATVSQVTATLGDPGNPKYVAQLNLTTAGTTATTLEQRIEDVHSFSGQTATISFYAQTVSGTATLNANLVQNFGTGGTPSATVTTSAGSANLTTAWQKFTLTVAVPSISGKALGTSGGDYLSLQLSLPAAVANIYIGSVQIEQGSVATPFEQRPIAQELALCQRYYEQSYDTGYAPGSTGSSFNGALVNTADATASYVAFGHADFAAAKRAAPSITLYSPATGASGVGRNANTNADLAASVTSPGMRGFGAYVNNVSVTGGQTIVAHWTANAEL